jgi:hypothetical protein
VTTTSTVRRYQFLGMHLAVTGTRAVLEALHSRLRYFPSAEQALPDLSFDFISLDPGSGHAVTAPAGRGRPIGPSLADGFVVEYYDEGDCLYMNYRDKVRALCDAPHSRVRVSIAYPEAPNLWTATRPIFVIALFELLKRRGYFNVHAAGLSIGGRVLLVAGHSGSGKSTLAAALCRAGFAFMADDYMFLSRRPEGLRALAFPEELEIRESAAGLIPELNPLLQTESPHGWWKHQVRAEDYWPTTLVWEGTAAALVFPGVANTPTSRIESMSAAEALTELVSNIQYTRGELAQEHLDVLGTLVRSCASYRLHTGRDLDALAAVLRDLLASSECVVDVAP